MDDDERRREIRAILIEMLDAAFTEDELDSICAIYFPMAFGNLQVGAKKKERIVRLVDFCTRGQAGVDDLLRAVQREEPRQYRRFYRRLESLLPFPEPEAREAGAVQITPSGLLRIALELVELDGKQPQAGTLVYAWLRVDDEDFDILGLDVQPVTWEEIGPRPVIFELLPRRSGYQDVRIELYQETTYLGAVNKPVQVRPAGQQGEPLQIRETIRLSTGVAPPDLLIRFYKADVRDGETIYHYRVTSTLPAGPQALAHMGSLSLNDPAALMQPVLQELDFWANLDPPGGLAEMNDRLARIGANLYRQLAPRELDEFYWSLPRQVHSVQIVSDVPVIPWEMLCPIGHDGRQDPALGRQFALTRWHPDARTPATRIKLDRVRLLLGQPKKPLKGALPEANALQELLGWRAVMIDQPQSVFQVMQDADFDALHLISHGYARSENADESYIELGGGPPLRASDLSSCNWAQRGPLLFVNACNVGREGIGLTGLGGWATTALARARAGAFVGAMWQATDGTAGEFAQAFYGQLLKGASVGEAALAARLTIAGTPDPTWLCYAVYAHPNACV